MSYLDPDKIRIYPSTSRSGSAEGDGTNILTEANLVAHVKNLFNKDCFVTAFDNTSNKITFYIGGYFVEADLSNIVNDFSDYIYAHCQIQPNGTDASESFYFMHGSDEDNESSFIWFDNNSTSAGATYNALLLQKQDGNWVIPEHAQERLEIQSLPLGAIVSPDNNTIATTEDINSSLEFVNTSLTEAINNETEEREKHDISQISFLGNNLYIQASNSSAPQFTTRFPDADSSTTGFINTSSQTFKGAKTFIDTATFNNSATFLTTPIKLGTDSIKLSTDKILLFPTPTGASTTDSVVTLNASQNLHNKTYEGYTLNAACAKSVVYEVGNNEELITSGGVLRGINAFRGDPITDAETCASGAIQYDDYDHTNYSAKVTFASASETSLIKIPKFISYTFGRPTWYRVTGIAPSASISRGSAPLQLPDSIVELGISAFSGCNRSIDWGNDPNIEIIADGAFNNYQGTSITIPYKVKSVGNNAFTSCPYLGDVYYNNDIASWCGISFGNEYANPLYVGTIVNGHNLHINGDLVTNVVIPDTVTEIGSYTFQKCTSLQKIKIPGSVNILRPSILKDCSNLSEVIIEEGVDTIENISGNSNISEIFRGCSNLTSITVPFIGNRSGVADSSVAQPPLGYLFSDVAYTGSTKVWQQQGSSGRYYYIPKSLRSVQVLNDYIPEGAFYGCHMLTSVKLGDGITGIGGAAFYNCSNLSSITIGSGLTSIGSSAFYDCHNLSSIVIPDSVTSIGSSAFLNCHNLSSITIPNNMTSIGGDVFFQCSNLSSITIPDSVTSIGNGAFSGCSNLTSVTIGSGLTSIGIAAFRNCSNLSSITIPGSVTSISSSAFEGCTNLSTIYIERNGGSIIADAPWGATNATVIYQKGTYLIDNSGSNLTGVKNSVVVNSLPASPQTNTIYYII